MGSQYIQTGRLVFRQLSELRIQNFFCGISVGTESIFGFGDKGKNGGEETFLVIERNTLVD